MLIFHICVNKYDFHRSVILFLKCILSYYYNVIQREYFGDEQQSMIYQELVAILKKFKYATDMYKTSTELQLAK